MNRRHRKPATSKPATSKPATSRPTTSKPATPQSATFKAAPLLAAIILLGLALPPNAQARVKHEPTLVLEGPVAPARAGEAVTLHLTLHKDGDKDLTGLEVSGARWEDLQWRISPEDRGDPEHVDLQISGKPGNAAAPLRVKATVGTFVLEREFVVGGPQVIAQRAPLKTRPARDWELRSAQTRPGPSHLKVEPAPAPAVNHAGHPIRRPEPNPDSKDRPIRVRGRFLYFRDGTTVLGADGMTVNIYDDDVFVDDLLGQTITDTEGNFDITVNWDPQPGQDHPDLLVELRTENSEVKVRKMGINLPYTIEVGPYDNYTGDDLLIGGILAEEEDMQGLGHMINNYTKHWRYMSMHGHDTRFLKVKWPGDNDDGCFYTRADETIQISRERTWNSGTLAHENGHHIMKCLASMPTIDYCNGICDNGDDCGHCLWCEESRAIAWSEGWANYCGHVIPRTFIDVYGYDCLDPMNMASVQQCGDGTFHDADLTEGYTAAALVDLVDLTNEDDPYTPGYDDRVTLSQTVILDCLDDDGADRTNEFFLAMAERYPEQKSDIWFTARNNGLEYDETPPWPVHPLICLTHTEGTPSANNEVTFYWNNPGDDFSGVAGYSTFLHEGSAFDPGPTLDMWEQPTNTKTYSDLDPGTYYFTIRSVDNAFIPSDDYVTCGPIIITEPEPRNLTFELRDNWWYYVVPRNTPDASLSSCPLPDELTSMEPTYWNLSARNEGDLSTGADMITALFVDGVEKDRYNWGNAPGWCPFVRNNDGPELVLGGLHTFSGVLDPDRTISETDEGDNRRGKQLAWRPAQLSPGVLYTAGTGIPDATGGWDSVMDMFVFYNSYGVGFNSSGWWNALVMWSDDETDDFDLRLHEVNENPASGFRFSRESSSQPAGYADAVVINRNELGSLNWDAAIVSLEGHAGAPRFRHETSELVAYGDSLSETMGDNQYLLLREFQVDTYETGGISLDLWTDPPQANVSFAWRDADFETGDILEADAMALTGADGHAHLEVVAESAGYTCLSICRRPMDGDEDLQVTYRIRPTLPDLTPAPVATWYAPVVPRPAADVTGDLVALPTHLTGDAEETWFNFTATNQSTGTCWAANHFGVYVDEGAGSFSYLNLFDFEGGETKQIVNHGPHTIGAGRHTVVLNLDPQNYVVEQSDENNTYGRQYAWHGTPLGHGDTATRDVPPLPTAGWPDIASGAATYYNCDGLSSNNTGTYWQAVAVMPGDASDVDLRLHEPGSGALSVVEDFGANLCWTSWGTGQSDYILVNFNLTDNRPLDYGVIGFTGNQDYQAHAIRETWLGGEAVDHGPVTMTGDEIIHVYEMRLPAGTWSVRVENLSGEVDWGLCFHRADMSYMAKLDVVDGTAASWYAEAGQDEWVTVTLAEQDYHAITVWKVGAADMGQEGKYLLHVNPGAPSPVPDEVAELPVVTRIAGAYPNPFNPVTTVAFELDHGSAVELAVFDVSGRRVTTLVQESLPAGRYQEVWQGLDTSGRRVASGMYVLRLRTDTTRDLKKVMLVK